MLEKFERRPDAQSKRARERELPKPAQPYEVEGRKIREVRDGTCIVEEYTGRLRIEVF